MLWVHTRAGDIQISATETGLQVSVTAKDGVEIVGNQQYPATSDGILPSWHVQLIQGSRSSTG